MLLLKGSLLRSVKGKYTERSNNEIEMSTDMVYTDNPLQNMSDNNDPTTNIDADSRLYELKMEIINLKTEITNKNQEITDLTTENTELKRKFLT